MPRYSSVRKIDPVLDLSNQNTALTSAVQCSHIPQGWIDAQPIQLVTSWLCLTRPIKDLTRHSTLAWLVRSPGLQGRRGNWAAFLSQWTLEVVKCKRGEDEKLWTLTASITPRDNVDSILSAITPKKQSCQAITVVSHTIEPDEVLYVVSVDGSAYIFLKAGQMLSQSQLATSWLCRHLK